MTSMPTDGLPGLMMDLAACLCNELTPAGKSDPGLCFCGVLPGDSIAADVGFECGESCGMAWVRMETAYPATNVGIPDADENTCGNFLGADLEIGVLRCIELPSGLEVPDAAELESVTAFQVGDMLAMRRAVKCCPALDDVEYLLGTYLPLGPEGGVVGGIWTVSVLL